MKGSKGFTLIEIMIVIGILGLISAIVFPNFLRAKATSEQNICISNLKHIYDAKSMWAVWEGMGAADTPDWSDIVPEYLKETPSCPAGGTYTINAADVFPECTEEGHTLSG